MPQQPPILSEADTLPWYEGKTFATDWTTWHFSNWLKWLAPHRERELRVLEIGSWEGRSALFFLNYLPRARLVCVDTFEGSIEHQAADDAAEFLPQVEKRFDANTSAFSSRIEKIKGNSTHVLPRLALANHRFDIAYVDGSHLAADVYSDGALTWPLMERGGLVIFDDYKLELLPNPLDNAKLGVDTFMAAFAGQYSIMHFDYQVVLVKL